MKSVLDERFRGLGGGGWIKVLLLLYSRGERVEKKMEWIEGNTIMRGLISENVRLNRCATDIHSLTPSFPSPPDSITR